MPPVLYLFALCNLVIGSGAFVLGGILVPLSDSLNVSLAAAGQVMTAYAISTALLAPVLIIATARWPRVNVPSSWPWLYLARDAWFARSRAASP
ncbi:hypothetical protein [Polaromonas sp.]|uniref:hypothetical protein n=1 Tax=Polaromonas sp. TaxID=1869339 RepID=UPI0025F7C2CA|nr:hypothetical protein [Polaromonas sp.]